MRPETPPPPPPAEFGELVCAAHTESGCTVVRRFEVDGCTVLHVQRLVNGVPVDSGNLCALPRSLAEALADVAQLAEGDGLQRIAGAAASVVQQMVQAIEVERTAQQAARMAELNRLFATVDMEPAQRAYWAAHPDSSDPWEHLPTMVQDFYRRLADAARAEGPQRDPDPQGPEGEAAPVIETPKTRKKKPAA